MERLTERLRNGGIRIKGCSTLYPAKERKGVPAANAIVRLAAYEDTGLEPEEIDSVFIHCVIEENKWLRELVRAEKDGRMVLLPCKVGDTVLIGRIGEKRALVSWYSTREEAEAALKKRE